MTTMLTTRIPGIQGLWSCHLPEQRPTDGVAVYRYPYHWACEVDGPWYPGQETKLPCRHIAAVLALREEQPSTLWCVQG